MQERAEDRQAGHAVTAPAPKYRYTFAVPIRHVMVRGNTTARTAQEVRDFIAMHWGVEIAEQARIELAAVEETT